MSQIDSAAGAIFFQIIIALSVFLRSENVRNTFKIVSQPLKCGLETQTDSQGNVVGILGGDFFGQISRKWVAIFGWRFFLVARNGWRFYEIATHLGGDFILRSVY